MPMGPVTHVLSRVAELYGTELKVLIGRDVSKAQSWQRYVAVYLAHELTGQSCAMIGRVAGGRGHDTIRRGINRVKEAISTDQEKHAEVRRIRAAVDTAELVVLASEAVTGDYRKRLIATLLRTISECHGALRQLGVEDTHVAP